MTENSLAERETRMSLWTVPRKWGGTFFVLLVAQGGLLIGLHAWRSLVLAPNEHVVDKVLSEVLVGTPMLVFAGILSMIELEVALTLSVWFEDRIRRKRKEEFEAGLEEARQEGRTEGFAEGVAEGRRLERERFNKQRDARSRARRYPY